MLCIHNHRPDPEGFDLGGRLYLDPPNGAWLALSIRLFLEDKRPRRAPLANDDLEIKLCGHDFEPSLGIYNRRSLEAPRGGVMIQTLSFEMAAVLADTLEQLGDRAKAAIGVASLDWRHEKECPQCGELAGWTGESAELWDGVALVMRCPCCGDAFNWLRPKAED